MSITGTVGNREGDKGNLPVNPVIKLPLRFEGVGRLIAGLLGVAGLPATVDTTARRHTFKVKDETDGIFWTWAYEAVKDTTIFEFNTVKITGITIRITIPGRIELEVRGIGHDFTDASAINTTTSIDAVTLPANREIAQARQVVIRMNAQAGGALGASDAVFVTALELSIDRPLEADFNTEYGDRSSEPMPPQGGDPFLKVAGSLTFSQLQTGTGGNTPFVLEQLSRTLKKMDIVITGDNLAGAATEKYSYKIFLPMVVMGEGKPGLAAGANGWTLPFTAHKVSVAPTGFDATYIAPVAIENVNQLTGDVLA